MELIIIIIFSVVFGMLLAKNHTVGSSCNLIKYWTDKNYKQEYDTWMSHLPK